MTAPERNMSTKQSEHSTMTFRAPGHRKNFNRAEAREHGVDHVLIHKRPFEEYGFTPVSKQLCEEVLRRAGVDKATIITADELATLRDLQARYEAHYALLEQCTPTAARAEYERQYLALPAALHADPAAEAHTWEHLRSTYAEKARALHKNLRELSEQAFPVYLAVAKRIEAAAEKVATEMEIASRAEAEKFGVPWRPDTALVLIGQLSWRLTADAPVCHNAPAYVMRSLPLDIEVMPEPISTP